MNVCHDVPYLQLLSELLLRGTKREDRTGVGTRSLFGRQLSFDLQRGFPLLTTKQVNFHAVAEEILWMLRGDTNVKSLNARGVGIWDSWANPNGDLGPIYGAQWRRWPNVQILSEPGPPAFSGSTEVRTRYIDQAAECLRMIIKDPWSRRIILNAWNVGQLQEMRLPPCHLMSQFSVREVPEVRPGDGSILVLDMHLVMRSSDIFLGLPFNISGYALMCHLFAHAAGLEPGTLIVSLGDVHLYHNHVEQAQEQLSRAPRASPSLSLAERVEGGPRDVPFAPWEWDWTQDRWTLLGYDPHPPIKAPVAV